MYNMALDCSEEGDLILEVFYCATRRSLFDLISDLCLRVRALCSSNPHAKVRSAKPYALE